MLCETCPGVVLRKGVDVSVARALESDKEVCCGDFAPAEAEEE